LRGVKRGKVRGAAASFGELDLGDRSRFFENLAAPYPDIARLPASQIDAVAADLVHQRRAVAVRSRPKRPCLQEGARLGQNVGSEVSEPVVLAPAICQVLEKHGDVVVGIRVRIAARPRAEKDQPLDASAVHRAERRAYVL